MLELIESGVYVMVAAGCVMLMFVNSLQSTDTDSDTEYSLHTPATWPHFATRYFEIF